MKVLNLSPADEALVLGGNFLRLIARVGARRQTRVDRSLDDWNAGALNGQGDRGDPWQAGTF